MNNKGFTLVELIASFALSSAIIFLLISIVIVVKNIYVNYELKTNLIINQGTLSKVLNEKLIDEEMITHSICSDSNNCHLFYYEDYVIKLFMDNGTVKVYTYETLDYINAHKLSSSDYVSSTDTISYNSKIYYLYNPYVYKLLNGSKIESFNVRDDEYFIVITISIKNKLYLNKDFGLNLVYRKTV